jgi:hypothetical protein
MSFRRVETKLALLDEACRQHHGRVVLQASVSLFGSF